MTLNLNSWHAKYYKLVLDRNPPKSLCPYFWTMVVFVVFAPIVLLAHYVIEWTSTLFDKMRINSEIKKAIKPRKPYDAEKERKKQIRTERGLEVFGKILIILGITSFVFFIGMLIFTTLKHVGFWNTIISTFFLVGVFTTLYHITKAMVDNRVGRKMMNSSFIQIPIEMVIAVYTKACPIVTWVGEQQKQVVNTQYKNN